MIKKHILLMVLCCVAVNMQAVLTPVTDSITMSDGRKLAADIYIPQGMVKGPVILIQTPYNRQVSRFAGLPMGIGQNLNSSNYIFVITDWRGFYGSAKAAYAGSPERGLDGYSTVEWIAKQSWSNGKIGTWGPSALGKIQYQTAKFNPPHLTCICPSVAASQFDYTEYYPGGALRTEYVDQLDNLGFGLSNVLLSNPYKNNVWNIAESANMYPDSIRVPCFMVGGWYDHNTQLMMDLFTSLKTKSGTSVRDKHKILMGPWVHGGNGSARVGTAQQGELSYPNAENKNDSMSLRFFDYHLRSVSNGWDTTPVYTWYQMGSNNWIGSQYWPQVPTTKLKFYVHSDLTFKTTPPQTSKDSLTYVYNPLDPSPTTGGSTLRGDLDQGPYDQRAAVESRSDALVISTDVFTRGLFIQGNVEVHLKVGSDRPDTDFDVRLTDVYPDGRSMLINDGVLRMRFRNGYTQAQTALMQPGNIYDCIISLPVTAISLQAGHRLRLIISSSNYPKYNRNANTGGDMYPGKSTDSLLNPLIANNAVHVSAGAASFIELPVLPDISGLPSLGNAQQNLEVFPVPASDMLYVRIPQTIESAEEILMYSAAGVLISRFPCSGSGLQALSLSGFSSGLYYLQMVSKGRLYGSTFVKQ